MGETNNLYRNDGRYFVDVTASLGLAAKSLGYTGWGTTFVDLNRDNLLDLPIFNGAVRLVDTQRATGVDYPFGESDQVFVQNDGRFIDASSSFRGALAPPRSSRGAAFGDIENDGDMNILVNNGNARPYLFVTETVTTGNWLGLVLRPAHRSVGAMVEFEIDGDVIFRRVHRDGSYASSSDPRMALSVPADTTRVRVKVRWANGISSEHQLKPANRYELVDYPNDD